MPHPLAKSGLEDISLSCTISEEFRKFECSTQKAAPTSEQNPAEIAARVTS